MGRALLTVAVAVLAVAAGCNAVFADGGGEETPEETLTPAPVPEVTPTPERWPVAPGVSGAGVVDVDVLVAAHLDFVSNRSYSWREYRTSGGSDANLTLAEPFRTARVVSENTYAYSAEQELVRLGRPSRYRYNYSEFVVDGVGYTKLPSFDQGGDGVVRLNSLGATNRIGGEAVTALRRYLPARNATVTETLVEGEQYYRIEGRDGDLAGVDPVSNYSVTALVSPAGFVRSLTVTYRTVELDESKRVRYRFVYSRVDETTVDPPDWVPAGE